MVTKPDPATTGWIAGSGAVAALIIFIGGVFLKDQDDISSLKQAEKDHFEEGARLFALMQAEIDHRIEAVDDTVRLGHTERLANDEKLGARLDTLSDSLNQRINEVQRQLSAIEGKLGDSQPTPPQPKY